MQKTQGEMEPERERERDILTKRETHIEGTILECGVCVLTDHYLPYNINIMVQRKVLTLRSQ
jgi:hypothetical protein